MKNKNVMAAVLTAVIVIGQGGFAGIKADAAEANLTKSQAVSAAQATNINALKLNTATGTINRKIAFYEELGKEITDLENGFQQYKTYYGSLTPTMLSLYNLFNHTDPANRTAVLTSAGCPPALIQQFTALNAAGTQLLEAGLVDSDLKPIALTQEQLYDQIVYPREVPQVIAKNMLTKAKLQQAVVNSAIDLKVKEGYDDILYGQDGCNLTEALYEKVLKDLDQLNAKYSVGVASKVQLEIGKREVQKIKLQRDNLNNQVDNGKIQLNQSMGVDLNTDYTFTDEKMNPGQLQDYHQYLSSAQSNRAELKAAQLDIEEKQYIYDLIKSYYTSDEPKYKEADNEVQEAKINYDEISAEIEAEIQNSYLNVQQKLSDKELADTKLKQAKSKYDAAKAGYDAGVIPVATMWNVDLLVNQAEINQAKAQRDYDNALYELEQSSNVGTTYVMEGVN